MSRTVRKSAKAFSINADSFVKHQTYRSHIRVVRRRKTEEEYQRDILQADIDYENQLKLAAYDNGKPYIGTKNVFDLDSFRYVSVLNYITKQRVLKFKYIHKHFSADELNKLYRDKYNAYSRDGACSETGKKSGFKKAATKYLRRRNKEFVKAVFDDDYDNLPYLTEHEADYLRWSFW